MICALCDKEFNAEQHRQRRIYCGTRCSRLAVNLKTKSRSAVKNTIPIGIRQKVADQKIVHPDETKYR